jgi:sulfite reductase alpha subunit-like flavoprotein
MMLMFVVMISDSQSIDGGLLPWIETFLEALLRYSHMPTDVPPPQMWTIHPPRVKFVPAEDTSEDNPEPLRHLDNYHSATVRCNERITAQDWFQDVRHLELDIGDDIQLRC